MKRFLSLLLFSCLLGASCFVQDARAGIFCDLLTTQSGVAYYPVQNAAVYGSPVIYQSSNGPQNSIISDIRSVIEIINAITGSVGGNGGGVGGGGGGGTSELKGTLDRIDQQVTKLEDLIKNRLARNEQDLKDEIQARQDSVNALETKMLDLNAKMLEALKVQKDTLEANKTIVTGDLAKKADQTTLDMAKTELKAEIEKLIRSTVLASQKQMLDDLTPDGANTTATTRLQNGPLKAVKGNFDANKYDERWENLKKIADEISSKK